MQRGQPESDNKIWGRNGEVQDNKVTARRMENVEEWRKKKRKNGGKEKKRKEKRKKRKEQNRNNSKKRKTTAQYQTHEFEKNKKLRIGE